MNVVKKFMMQVGDTMIKNRPVITTVAAIGAFGLTIYAVVKEAPKINEVKERHQEKIQEIEDLDISEAEKQTKKKEATIESAKEVAKPVGKIAGCSLLTVLLILGINKAHSMKTEALIAAYEVSKGKVMGYEKALPDLIGPKKAQELQTEVAAAVGEEQAIIHGDKGTTLYITDESKILCRDIFGNEWIGTYNDIEAAKNEVNAMLSCNESVTLNEFYSWLPNCSDTTIGDEMTFEAENGNIDIRYSTTFDHRTHKPILIVDYHCEPVCTSARFSRNKDGNYGDFIRRY